MSIKTIGFFCVLSFFDCVAFSMLFAVLLRQYETFDSRAVQELFWIAEFMKVQYCNNVSLFFFFYYSNDISAKVNNEKKKKITRAFRHSCVFSFGASALNLLLAYTSTMLAHCVWVRLELIIVDNCADTKKHLNGWECVCL